MKFKLYLIEKNQIILMIHYSTAKIFSHIFPFIYWKNAKKSFKLLRYPKTSRKMLLTENVFLIFKVNAIIIRHDKSN